jgi:GNAT superfamily N-acetyltransferase
LYPQSVGLPRAVFIGKTVTLELNLRSLRPSDGDALRQLIVESPDTGRFSIAADYQIDPYLALTSLHTSTIGVVAEVNASSDNRVVGLGLVRMGNCYLDGSHRPFGLLNNLVVHPDYRCQGVASQLVQWRIAHVRQTTGDETVILAFIQENNSGSLATAQKWAQQSIGHYVTCTVPTSQQPISIKSEFVVRLAESMDMDQVTENLNEFYQGYNLYEPHTAVSLMEWLQQTPISRPFRQYHVAVDKQQNILAGLAVTEYCQLATMNVKRLPLLLNWLNKVVKMVPPDGVLRQLAVTHFWFQPGREVAAQHLWQTVRYQYRDIGSHLTFAYDPQGPFPEIIQLPFWLPRARFQVLAGNGSPLAKDKPIYPL